MKSIQIDQSLQVGYSILNKKYQNNTQSEKVCFFLNKNISKNINICVYTIMANTEN